MMQLKEIVMQMETFNLEKQYQSIITNNNIINLMCKVHEYKGKQSYLLETQKDSLDNLVKIAKIESTTSSNKIEGIFTLIKE